MTVLPLLTSREYLPYLVLALSMLFVFNIFPRVLLTLCPFKFFQHCLNCLRCMKYRLPLQLYFYLALAHVKPKLSQCFKRIRALFLLLKRKTWHKLREDIDSENSESTLINRGNAGYNIFTSCTTIDIVCTQWLAIVVACAKSCLQLIRDWFYLFADHVHRLVALYRPTLLTSW